ncbi:MAG: hypothetical protein K0Q74_1669, partial [Gammaproteobacteria bacterium]|nr:hypothetical protein [Gammaproteobacteria bacterium]
EFQEAIHNARSMNTWYDYPSAPPEPRLTPETVRAYQDPKQQYMHIEFAFEPTRPSVGPEIYALMTQIEGLRQENTELRIGSEKLKARNDELEAENNQLKIENAEAKSAVTNLLAKIEEERGASEKRMAEKNAEHAQKMEEKIREVTTESAQQIQKITEENARQMKQNSEQAEKSMELMMERMMMRMSEQREKDNSHRSASAENMAASAKSPNPFS